MEKLTDHMVAFTCEEMGEVNRTLRGMADQFLQQAGAPNTPSTSAGVLMGAALEALAEAAEHNLEVFLWAVTFYTEGAVMRDAGMREAHMRTVQERMAELAFLRMDTKELTKN